MVPINLYIGSFEKYMSILDLSSVYFSSSNSKLSFLESSDFDISEFDDGFEEESDFKDLGFDEVALLWSTGLLWPLLIS